MATVKTSNKLTAAMIRRAAGPIRLSDGDRLYLCISETGTAAWEFRFERHGRRRTLGLGGYPSISIQDARKARDDAAELLRQGQDPIDARKNGRSRVATALNVREAAQGWLAAMRPKLKTNRTASQIERRLEQHVFPTIGNSLIADLGIADIERTLAPIWVSKHQTASRIRGYLEGIIDWSIASGARTNDSNPAELKRLKFLLPHGLTEVEHFDSLAPEDVPALYQELCSYPGIKALALRFLILTAVRSADVCSGGYRDDSAPMSWTDVDFEQKIWTIPTTKNGNSHTVPLSDEAVDILEQARALKDPCSNYCFPGGTRGTPLSTSTLRYLLRDLGYAGKASPHGFRASFRTWASETTTFEKGVIEAALAHSQGELDRAYHRGSFLAKRAVLMQDWNDHVTSAVRAVRAEAA